VEAAGEEVAEEAEEQPAAAEEEQPEVAEEGEPSGLARQTRSAGPAKRLGTIRQGQGPEARARLACGGAQSAKRVGPEALRAR
jgi:hypothetical protein